MPRPDRPTTHQEVLEARAEISTRFSKDVAESELRLRAAAGAEMDELRAVCAGLGHLNGWVGFPAAYHACVVCGEPMKQEEAVATQGEGDGAPKVTLQ